MTRRAAFITRSAVIAAVYALLTIAVAPISSGLMQCRVSEALCVLPYFTAAALPGLFVGCLLANLLTGAAIYDVIFGSLATLLAAAFTRLVSFSSSRALARLLAPLPAVLVNAVIVGYILAHVYAVGAPFLLCAAYVGLGQALACYAGGLPLMRLLEKYRDKLF